MFRVDTYLDRKGNLVLFFVVLGLTMILALGIGIYSGDQLVATKASEIIGAGTIVVFILALLTIIESQLKRETRNGMSRVNNHGSK